MNDLDTKIRECFPGKHPPTWTVGPGGKLRLFLPLSTTLDQVLELRRWLMLKNYMGPDSGFVVKQDDSVAFLFAHLDVKELS